jgi:hypothetical protein
MPEAHVILDGSALHLTLLDIRPLWDRGLPDGTAGSVWQVIAADTPPTLHGEDLKQAIVDDLLPFVPFLSNEDVERVVLHENDDVPLFMNDAGTDFARPVSDVVHGRNLLVAGDWCRTPIYLACMEGAVVSGAQAAAAVLRSRGRDAKDPWVPPTSASRLAKVAVVVLAPVLWLLSRPAHARRVWRARSAGGAAPLDPRRSAR